MPSHSRWVADLVDDVRLPGISVGRPCQGGPSGLRDGRCGIAVGASGRRAERDPGLPVCGGAHEEPVQGHWPMEAGSISDETDEERARVLLGPTRRRAGDDSDGERPRGVWAVYQGRASHRRLGTNVPMQIELFWSYIAGRRVSGTWFMLRDCVDVVAERTSDWHLIVRAVSGGTSATLLGKWVAPNRLAGDFWFGDEDGGAFELFQCPQASMSADSVHWASSSHSGNLSTADSLVSLPIHEPAGYYAGPPPEQGIEPSVQDVITEAAAEEVDSPQVFTTEVQLAKALVDVLKTHPNGLPLAQFKSTIYSSAGLWVSEAFLGYKKLRKLIKSPIMSKVCWTQRIGSCDQVFGHETAVDGTRFTSLDSKVPKQRQHVEGVQELHHPPGLGPPGTFAVMSPGSCFAL